MKPVISVINSHNISTLKNLTLCFIRQYRNFATSNYKLCHVCPFLRPSFCLVPWLKQDNNTKQCRWSTRLFGDSRGTVQRPTSLQLRTGSTNHPKARLCPREYMGEWVGWIIQAVVLAFVSQGVRYFRQASRASKNTKKKKKQNKKNPKKQKNRYFPQII